MTEAEDLQTIDTTADDAAATRIYEVGYHILPSVAEENVEKVVGEIRAVIEQAGGSFIAEGAPVLTKLAYDMDSREGDKWASQDRGYFGWIKFEAVIGAAQTLEEALKANKNILRHIVFRTVREETRARLKTPTLREVKRTDTIKTTARRPEEESAPVSEEDLDKALSDITTD
jgi:ribosomal protein S6